MGRIIERHWTWHFPCLPMAVWEVLADTARFNEAAGFPKHQIEQRRAADGTISYIGLAKLGWYTVTWQDIPIEWIEGERFRHCRAFANTPIRRLCASLTLSAEGAGTRADYHLEIEPRNWLGRPIARRLVRGAENTYARLIKDVRAALAGERARPYRTEPAEFSAAVRQRIATAIARIEARGFGHGYAERIAAFLEQGSEIDLMHIRPRALARLWGLPERPFIECCLEAVDVGLLGMDWQILCPRCRGAKTTAATLSELPERGHCLSCNVDYARDFAHNVELTFHPAPAVRPVDHGEFCLFGPRSTPHVKIQQTLDPGETRSVGHALNPGAYRYRTLNATGEIAFEYDGGAVPALIVEPDRITLGAAGAPATLVISNTTERRQTVVVEEREWARDALTAHRVTTMQRFRDLFDAEILRPGDEIPVEHIALMFSDLRGSTALYQEIGDAQAYKVVREHFVFLAGVIRRHDGAIVKTIGDAVMAAFADPADALSAAIRIQQEIAAFNADTHQQPLVIKLGLHDGPAIAVTLNGQLDYFGTTVNLAARLQSQSRGGDIVLSEALAADPGVAEVLAGLSTEHEVAALKGLDEAVPFLRISRPAVNQGLERGGLRG